MDSAYTATTDRPVSGLGVDARATFITRTYTHLFGAIAAFTLLEVALFRSGMAERIAGLMLGTSWLVVLGAFMVVSWIASRVAHTVESMGAQYAALAVYVLAEALIFVPLLWFAFQVDPAIVEKAAGITLLAFAGLTAIAVITGRDFSFLKSFLAVYRSC